MLIFLVTAIATGQSKAPVAPPPSPKAQVRAVDQKVTRQIQEIDREIAKVDRLISDLEIIANAKKAGKEPPPEVMLRMRALALQPIEDAEAIEDTGGGDSTYTDRGPMETRPAAD